MHAHETGDRFDPAARERGGTDAIIWEMEPRGRRFTYVSGRAETLLGYPLRRWLGEAGFWLRLLHPDDRERADALCRDAIENLRNHELEYRVVADDGRVLWIRDRVNVVQGADGRARLLQGVMVDVTALKSAEAGALRNELHARRAADRMRAIAAASPDLHAADSIDVLRHVLEDLIRRVLRVDTLRIDLDGNAEPDPNHDAAGGRVIRASITDADRCIGSIRVGLLNGQNHDPADQAVLDVIATIASLAVARLLGSSQADESRRALRRGESLTAVLQEVTEAAIEARTFNEAAARCLAAICGHAGWPTAHVFVRTDEGDVVSTGIWEITAQARYREITAVASRIRYRPGIGIVGRVLTTGEPVWVRDVTADPAFLRRAADAEIRGAFAFPVEVGGEVAAVLEFLSRDAVDADPALIDLSRRIGALLGRVIERERIEEQIHFQARMLDSVGQAVIASDAHHRVIYWNRGAEHLFGWPAEQAIGRVDSELLPARVTPQQTADITARLAAGQSWAGEYEIRARDGTDIPVHLTASIIYDATGAPAGHVGVATDLRRSKELEQKLRQAQRLESVGRLAGGVAHDFNNLLTSIKGVTLLLLDDLPPDSPLRADLEEIRRAADRAATLTSQLLAFSRRQVLKPRVLDLNPIVRETVPVLRRLVGEAIDITVDLDPELGHVRVDTSQIGHVIVNVASNARDAMPAGGKLVIRTRNVDLTEEPRTDTEDLHPGPYVLLEVQDEGSGIPEGELEHIFEPFYTTKRHGLGLGLGLSTVYGIVRQSDGHIVVDSIVGAGTTFRIFLPRVQPEAPKGPEPAQPAASRGSETLLLVEDEESVRRLARKILARQGYTVLEAANGVEALELCARHAGRIDLVVSDVVMPFMSGVELTDRLQAVRPGLPVLLMSGYTGDALGHDLTDANERFLEKPFTPDALARKVRSLLDAVAREAAT